MTLEEKYELSCYEELTRLHDTKDIFLVRHNENGHLFVKKRMNIYNKDVYVRLKVNPVPDTPKIIICAEEDNNLVVIEEYIHGTTLSELIESKGCFSESEAIDIMIQLCKIVENLHEQEPPVIHRDIKPDNIILSNDNVIKLIDFNAAKEVSIGTTEDTYLIGTKEFAAPEQYGFMQSDRRTDIYALGVTLNYLLTKKVPKIKMCEGILAKIITLCIEIDAKNRYQKVVDLENDLLRAKKLITQKDKIYKDNRNNRSNEGEEIKNRKLYQYRDYLPVGFRSGTLWKMITAVYGYVFALTVTLTMDFQDENGKLLNPVLLWENRIAIGLCIFGMIFFFGNYKNIRYNLPGMRGSKVIHWILAIFYIIAYMFFIILLLTLFEDL